MIINSFIKILENRFEHMTVKNIDSHPITMTHRFESNWEPFGKKTFSVGYSMVEAALVSPETTDGIIYPLYKEEMDQWKKLIVRKEEINKILNNE